MDLLGVPADIQAAQNAIFNISGPARTGRRPPYREPGFTSQLQLQPQPPRPPPPPQLPPPSSQPHMSLPWAGFNPLLGMFFYSTVTAA